MIAVQLFITDEIACHCYAPNPQLPATYLPITVPLIPASQCLNKSMMSVHPYSLTFGDMMPRYYWVVMLQDIDKYLSFAKHHHAN